jgi:hypothetical protein
MRFWFDRTVPKRLAALVRVFDTDNEICHFSEDARVTQSTTDVELAALLNGDGDTSWIVVTIEIDQRRHRSFGAAMALTNIRHVVLTNKWSEKDFSEQTWRLLRLWPSITRVLKFTDIQMISISAIQSPSAFETAYILGAQGVSVNPDSEVD